MNMKNKKKWLWLKVIIGVVGIAVIGGLTIATSRWVRYVDELNANDDDMYPAIRYDYMGSATDGQGMCIVTKEGERAHMHDYIVSTDTLVYRRKVYDYMDLRILNGDVRGVEYEYHFVNVDTKEEEVYSFKPFENIEYNINNKIYEKITCFIENGEKKIFFRYQEVDLRYVFKKVVNYGAYIYNFDTDEYELVYSGLDGTSKEFVEMERYVRNVIKSESGGILGFRQFDESNDYSSDRYLMNESYGSIYPGVVVTIGSNVLPENNEELYRKYPELRNYIGHEGYYIGIMFPAGTSYKEIARLIMEEGSAISYENVTLYETETNDGQIHEISSYEEFLEYWDEDKYMEDCFGSRMWTVN